jgi:hypothetical protein
MQCLKDEPALPIRAGRFLEGVTVSTKQKPRGGARVGAGRKSDFGAVKQTNSVCLTPGLWAEIKARAAAEGISRNQWIEAALRRVVDLQ